MADSVVVAAVLEAVVPQGVGRVNFLNTQEKEQIREKIREVEKGTQAEIVTIIASESDQYRYIPFLWAALAALSYPGLQFAFDSVFNKGWNQSAIDSVFNTSVYLIQVLVFLGLGALFQLAPIKPFLIPKSVKMQRAARFAREQFFQHKLHETDERTGILLFVSVAEHYVEIIADTGIAKKVEQDHWQRSVNNFVSHVRQGQIATGFLETIEDCKKITWEHFPAAEKNPDELPNHLIEIEFQ